VRRSTTRLAREEDSDSQAPCPVVQAGRIGLPPVQPWRGMVETTIKTAVGSPTRKMKPVAWGPAVNPAGKPSAPSRSGNGPLRSVRRRLSTPPAAMAAAPPRVFRSRGDERATTRHQGGQIRPCSGGVFCSHSSAPVLLNVVCLDCPSARVGGGFGRRTGLAGTRCTRLMIRSCCRELAGLGEGFLQLFDFLPADSDCAPAANTQAATACLNGEHKSLRGDQDRCDRNSRLQPCLALASWRRGRSPFPEAQGEPAPAKVIGQAGSRHLLVTADRHKPHAAPRGPLARSRPLASRFHPAGSESAIRTRSQPAQPSLRSLAGAFNQWIKANRSSPVSPGQP